MVTTKLNLGQMIKNISVNGFSSRARISQIILSIDYNKTIYLTNVLGTKTLYASFVEAHCKIH
jgi:hypothetical protein